MTKSVHVFYGELTGYEFTKHPNDDKRWVEWVYFVAQIQVDGGAGGPVHHAMLFGEADRYRISDDGRDVTMECGLPVTFAFGFPFGRFIESLLNAAENAGVDIESELPNLDEGEALNLEALVGRRFRFKQGVDEEANAKFGKRVVGTGKNKREHDRTSMLIDAVLDGGSGATLMPRAALIAAMERQAPARRAPQDEQSNELEEAVVRLLNLAMVPNPEGTTEYHCTICGDRDFTHADACPIPVLEEWINPNTLD